MIISVDPSTAEDIATFAMVKQYTLQTIQVTLEITGWTADAEHGGYVKTKSQGITGSLVTFTDPSAIVSYNITDGDTSNFDIASLAGIKLDSIVAGQTSYDFTFRADELPTDNTVIDVLVYGTQIVGGGSGGDPTSAEEITAAALQALDDRVTALEGAIEAEETARAEADTALGGRIDTEQARAEAAEQANAQAIADTYTKAETDTLLAGKADTTVVQTLDTRVGALETGLADTYNKSQTDTLLAAKLDTLSTTGLHAYAHNGATQSEVSVIDGTTASTIPIRDANGRLQAADPASGATDRSLVTANWVSQTGTDAPNNLFHTNGNEIYRGNKEQRQGGTDPIHVFTQTSVNLNNPISNVQNITFFQFDDVNNYRLGALMIQRRIDNGTNLYIGVRNADGSNKWVLLGSGNQ